MRSTRTTKLIPWAGSTIAALALAAPGLAKSCMDSLPYQYPGQPVPITFCSPVILGCHLTPPPEALWGELEPRQVLNNSTHYAGSVLLNSTNMGWTDLDIEGDRMVVSHWAGLAIYDVANPNAVAPPITVMDGWNGDFPAWLPGLSEIDQLYGAVAIPDGDPTFAVLAGVVPAGVAIVDLTDPGTPVVRYQDDTTQVVGTIYAAQIGTRSYAFVPTQAGMRIYDLTHTREQGCDQAYQTSGTNQCPGTRQGIVGGPGGYVNGVRLASGRVLLVSSSGWFDPAMRVDVWDAEPLVEGTTTLPLASRAGTRTHGVAIWEHRDPAKSVYLAAREDAKVQVYSLSGDCLAGGSCSGEPALVDGAFEPVPLLTSVVMLPLTFSWSGDVPFIFVGEDRACVNSPEPPGGSELVRLASPGNPALLELADISPRQTVAFSSWTLPDPDGIPPAPEAVRTVDYWGWYAGNHSWGWGSVKPRAGRFKGAHFFRAANTVGDVHVWTLGLDPIFADGFESGDAAAWSATVP